MKIISKRKDYYDQAAGAGYDDSIHFIRDHIELLRHRGSSQKEDDFKKEEALQFLDHKNANLLSCPVLLNKTNKKKTHVILSVAKVLFCGKLYSCIIADYFLNSPGIISVFGNDVEHKQKIFYDLDKLMEFLEENEIDLSYEPQSKWESHKFVENFSEKIKKRIEGCFVVKDEFFDLALEKKIVVATFKKGYTEYGRYNAPDRVDLDIIRYDWHTQTWIRPDEIIINGFNLNELQFFKVFDFTKAYQELEMFIGGVLTSIGNKMVEVSDKSKIAKHGFDKRSFRKEPTKKREKWKK